MGTNRTSTDWGWINDLRTISFHEATSDNPTPDYWLRRVFRWYGSKFSMSPHLVEELPLYDVLRHYFEDDAENAFEDDARYRQVLHSIVYGEEMEKEGVIAKVEDDEFMQKVKEGSFAKHTAKRAPSPAKPVDPIVSDEGAAEVVDFSELSKMDMEQDGVHATSKIDPTLSRLERARRQG